MRKKRGLACRDLSFFSSANLLTYPSIDIDNEVSSQITAESVLYELTPTHPSLNNRNRRPVQQLMHNPRDMQHGMQLAYDLIATVCIY